MWHVVDLSTAADVNMQPDCQPLLELLRRWEESKNDIKLPHKAVRALSQAQFNDMMPERMNVILQDVFVVRDEGPTISQ